MSHASPPDGLLRRWGSTLPVLILLVGTVLHWVASGASGRLIRLGGELWPGYAIELRRDLPRPEPVQATASTEAGDADDALIGDLLGDDPPAEGAADDALIGDLLGDDLPAEGTADDALIGDLLADPPPSAPAPTGAADDALIGDLLADQPPSAPAPTGAADVPDPTVAWEDAEARKTPALKAFRAVEVTVSDFTAWGNRQFGAVLVLLVLFAGATATATRGHISLRPVRTVLDDRISQLAQLVANCVLAASLVRLYQLNMASGTELEHAAMPLLWAAAFGGMGVLNVYLIARPIDSDAPGSWSEALLTPPLYTSMALASAGWFVLGEQYLAGLGVYLGKLTEHGELYVFVGLYVWTGMLLKRTRIVQRGFDVLRPWKLPPDLLAVLLVAAAALPTAYSGASGIFVIATGALVYDELRTAGARPQLALAATAMSGSLGVVLSPCLLVVIVAYLNPPTTDQLYSWGAWVYLLTAGLFGLVVFLTRQSPFRVAPFRSAGPQSAAALRPLAPYVVVGAVTLGASVWLLEAGLDEHTAPMLLPLFLIAVLAWERRTLPAEPAPSRREGVWAATSETTVHMGALLLLMCLSIALGGVFERSEVMGFVPADLGSPWLVMSVLVVVLVVVGMTMDPYGAVILVSATVASIAYRSGIDETHFWMVVLVAFELGYLTPPVALNHLLTRQVVGADAVADARAALPANASFWRRHEQLLLPVTVMGTALLLVAFVPLFFYA